MYTKTIIENADELIQALSKTRTHGNNFPRIDAVELDIDSDGITLNLVDDRFDITAVNPVELLATVLKERNINLTVHHE